MEIGIQKASIWKRLSAFILDAIIVVILATGVAFATSAITGYDTYSTAYNQKIEEYETKHNIKFDIVSTEEELHKLSPEYQERYYVALGELQGDKDALYNYNMVINLTMVIVSVSILSSFLIAEFILPIIFKNGQTLGKKIFSVCVVKNNCVKLTTLQLFVRSILGKCVIETMIPAALILMIFFNIGGLFNVIVIGLLGIFQIVLLIATKNNCLIHDVFAYTAVVDIASQRIFNTEEELIEYEKETAKEEALKKGY